MDRPFLPDLRQQWTSPSFFSWLAILSLRCHVARHVNREQRQSALDLAEDMWELAIACRSLRQYVHSMWATVGPQAPKANQDHLTVGGPCRRMWMLDLPQRELGSRFFLWRFSRRYVPRAHHGLWWRDLEIWAHFKNQDPESQLNWLAGLTDLPGIEQTQDELKPTAF